MPYDQVSHHCTRKKNISLEMQTRASFVHWRFKVISKRKMSHVGLDVTTVETRRCGESG